MSKYFGVEIEVSDRGCGTHLQNPITPAVRKNWGITNPDYNINCGTDHCGFEFRTPKMRTSPESINGIRNFIKRMYSEIGKNGFPRESSLFHGETGMHVHIDLTTLNKNARNNMFKTFFLFENRILHCQPECRTDNQWCKRIRTQDRLRRNPDLINTGDFSRSSDWTNVLSRYNCARGVCLSDNYPTVEVRYGRTTFDHNDVVNWILLLLLIVENAKHMPPDFRVPITNQSVNKRAESKKAFIKFIEEAETEKNMRWLKHRRKSVARWVDGKFSALRA